MKYHVLDKITCKIQVVDGKPYKPATTLLSNIVVDKLYSYIVYNKKQDEYAITVAYSQIDEYNTILKEEAICEISDILMTNNSDNNKKRVIGFRQPPLELFITLAEPLVEDLAIQMHEKWNIELDDLRQMCYLSICKLNKNGYYLHPGIIGKTFRNDVLKSIQHEKNAPEIKSIDNVITDNDGCTIGDTIFDEYAEEKVYESITKEDEEFVLVNMRDLIIDIIGQREYDQFIREYGNRYTTNVTRTKINRLKRKLRELGVNYTWFDGTTIKRSK